MTLYRWVLLLDLAVGSVAALVVAWWFGRRTGGASPAWLITWSGIGAAIGGIVFFPALFMATVWSPVSDRPTPRSMFAWSAASIVILTAGFCGRVAQNRSRLRGLRR